MKNIFEAIRANDLESVKQFLEVTDFTKSDEETGRIPLDLALELELDDIAELLLTYTSDDVEAQEAPKKGVEFDIDKLNISQPLEHLASRVEKQENVSAEPIAIISMGGRFPGSGEQLSGFWQMLAEGKDAITHIPSDRWSVETYYSPQRGEEGKSYAKTGAFIQQDVKTFDAGFFNISPKEANYLDPQQRILLEVVYEALESAHIPLDSLNESDTGIYIGIATQDYAGMINQLGISEASTAYTATGNAYSTAAGRIAYWLGSQGPTMSIETACSSSLVALHQACQSIRQGESTMAIVGGVNLLLSANNFIIFSQSGMLAEDGKCKAFSSDADGYGRGEGCGVVILKRLSEAQADNNNILAVIRGSAVNQDGKSSGLTVPNGPAQEKLIHKALKQANLSPNDIDYIEAHGTGTSLGDPIEFNAIKSVFSTEIPRRSPLIVGTAKTYVGHLEAAAGIVGLIKTVLSLQYQRIPKLLHFKKLNSNITLNKNLALPVEAQEWKVNNNRLRRAGISSFGFSGTNAHVIIEEGLDPAVKPRDDEPTPVLASALLVISAKSAEALVALKEKYITYLSATTDSLRDIAYTCAIGRNHFKYRFAMIAKTKEELVEKIKNSAAFNNNEDAELLAMAKLYLAGEVIDWQAYYSKKNAAYYKVNVPTYAFQRQLYWLEALEKPRFNNEKLNATYSLTHFGQASGYSLLGHKLLLNTVEHVFQQNLSDSGLAYLQGHKISGYSLMPGMGYVEVMLAGAKLLKKSTDVVVRHLTMQAPLILTEKPEQTHWLQTVFTPTKDGYDAAVYSYIKNAEGELEGEMVCHARGKLASQNMLQTQVEHKDIHAIRERCQGHYEHKAFYAEASKLGYEYHGRFQGVEWVAYNETEMLAKITIENTSQEITSDKLDAAIQSSLVRLFNDPRQATYLPIEFENIRLPVTLDQEFYVYASLINGQMSRLEFLDVSGKNMGTIEKITTKQISQRELKRILQVAAGEKDNSDNNLYYHTVWEVQSETIEHNSQGSCLWLLPDKATAQVFLNQENVSLLGDIWLMDGTFYHSKSKVWSELYKLDTEYSTIIYGWTLVEEVQHTGLVTEHLQPMVERLLTFLKNIVQKETLPRLLLLTQGAQLNIQTGMSVSNMTQSVLNGFCKALDNEYPELNLCHLDLDPTKLFRDQLGSIIHEAQQSASHFEREIVCHENQRYVSRLVAFEENTADNGEEKQPLRLDSRGSYLITGGLTGLGLAVAGDMVAHGAKQLILLGRRNPSIQVQQQLVAWQAQGIDVVVRQIDVCHREDLVKLFSEFQQQKLQPLKGIIHAAGVIADDIMLQQTWKHFDTVFQAKVYGSWSLHELSQTLSVPLDFFVLFSSMASMLGSAGQINYASANAFMDRLAHQRRQQGLAGTSIHWGAWAEIGLAADLQASIARYGIKQFNAAIGLAAFNRILSDSSLNNLIDPGVLAIDGRHLKLSNAGQRHYWRYVKTMKEELKNNTLELSTLSRLSATEREHQIKQLLMKIINGVLGQNEKNTIDEDLEFTEMGFDSLMTMELRNRLQALFNDAVYLPVIITIEYPNFTLLNQYLIEELNKVTQQESDTGQAEISETILPAENTVIETQSSLYLNCAKENERDIDEDALFTCVKNNNQKMADTCLKRGRNVNMQDSKGKTSLHIAVQYGYKEMVAWLLTQGADLHLKTSLDVTPLSLAIYKHNFDLVKVMLAYLPLVDEGLFSLTTNSEMIQCLSAVSKLRSLILESKILFSEQFKENILHNKLFYNNVTQNEISELLSQFSEIEKLFIESLIPDFEMNTISLSQGFFKDNTTQEATSPVDIFTNLFSWN